MKIDKTLFTQEILEEVFLSLKRKERVWIRGIGGTPLSLLLISLSNFLSYKIFLVCEEEEAKTIYLNLKELTNKKIIYFGNKKDTEKINAPLYTLAFQNSLFFITTPEYIVKKVPSPEEILSKAIILRKSKSIRREKLIGNIEEMGYERVERVEMPGEWSARGGIIDIFTPDEEKPFRVELEEDKIASIRSFDPYSQKSLYHLEEIPIISLKKDVEERTSLLKYLGDKDLVLIHESGRIKEIIEKESDGHKLSWGKLVSHLANLRVIFTSWLPYPPPLTHHLLFSFSFQSLKGLSFSFNTLYNSLRRWGKDGFRVFISGFSGIEKERFQGILKSKGIRNYEFVEERLQEGFLSDDLKVVLITPKEILGYQPLQKRVPKGEPIHFPYILHEGDYVVHTIHGIGKFLGLRKEKIEGEKKEFLVIEYAGEDLLYVPVEGLHLVEKYIGVEDNPPPLSRLGSSRWRKTKEKVKNAIKDISIELLHIQALRQTQQGFSFSKDTEWQKEFESTFPYRETSDQIKVIKEVKKGMESSSPMDRLICGDTGFGKTEVALRAAFKASLDGKQVAVLSPTTLLAHQHYLNFKERLKDFPVKVEVLSRFVSKGKREEILRELKEGKIDIVIGTHLLLIDKVKFKDLGLLIIDEEHRFGVKQKEKIKQIRHLVDVLSLSATPIPRTLYLSLSGIRDISLILTPPPERLEVETEVREFNLSIIKESIEREIKRRGQVFFVHNNICDLESFQSIIKKLVPQARTAIIHGKMKSKELEKELMNFIQKKIDVLITTTIIASGLDIPNANTIIVNEAHKFGLSELYQLRGRVGRYKLKAYAYFLTPPKYIISHEARRRLYAIQTFAHLGSGYKLAIEDLQIRGAGDLLGEKQHGHIQKVGLALYTELLSRTIAEIKGETYIPYIPTQVELGLSISLPSEFLDEKEKLLYYKRLSQTKEIEEVEDIRKELEDRLKILPPESINLFEVQKIKIISFKKGIEYIRKTKSALLIKFFREILIHEKAEILHNYKPGKVFITPQGEIGYKMKDNENVLSVLKRILSIFSETSKTTRS